jgi:hypothetical protein
VRLPLHETQAPAPAIAVAQNTTKQQVREYGAMAAEIDQIRAELAPTATKHSVHSGVLTVTGAQSGAQGGQTRMKAETPLASKNWGLQVRVLPAQTLHSAGFLVSRRWLLVSRRGTFARTFGQRPRPCPTRR